MTNFRVVQLTDASIPYIYSKRERIEVDPYYQRMSGSIFLKYIFTRLNPPKKLRKGEWLTTP